MESIFYYSRMKLNIYILVIFLEHSSGLLINLIIKNGKVVLMKISLRLLVLFIGVVLVGSSMVQATSLLNEYVSIWAPNQTTGNYRIANLSGTVVLNASYMNATFDSVVNVTHGNDIVNMTFFWFLQGAASPTYNVSILNTTANQTTPFTATFNTANLPDGVYTLNVTAYNSSFINDALGRASNVSVVSFIVDNTPPNVTNIYVGNLTDGANLSAGLAAVGANYLLNISLQVNDSMSIRAVRMNLTLNGGLVSASSVFSGITNGTYRPGYIGNNTIFVANGTFTPNFGVNNTGNYTPAAINVSALSDGVYTIYIAVNDTNGNRNVSSFTFTVDRTAPTVSVSCTSNPKAGETVTCTCTASDGTSGVVTSPIAFEGDSNNEESTTASGTSGTSSRCRVVDYAGNSASATGSWTVVAATTTGSGPGGSGSGVTSKAAGQFSKKVWTSVNKGELVSLDVADAEVAVSKISFTAAQNAYGVALQVQKVSVLPKDVPALDKNVYKYVSISQVNLAKAIEGGIDVTFIVSTAWLSEKGLAKENVALHRFVNGQWVVLDTTFSEEDGGYVTYIAQTPGFSYFAIAEGKAVAAPVAEKKEGVATVGGEKQASTASEGTTPGSSGGSSDQSSSSSVSGGSTQVMGSGSTMVWVIVVIVIVVVIGLVWWFMSRKTDSGTAKKK